jgi:hypothetical protein
MPTRTPEEIRASIEQNRAELGASLENLRHEVEVLTDWRSQLRAHQQQFVIGAGAGGFVIGGGLAGVAALLSGRGERKAQKSERKPGKSKSKKRKKR